MKAFAFLLVLSLTMLERPARAEPPADEADAPVSRKKTKFRRSKLTHDESEGVADRRRLHLSTGEDKTVDLDFDLGDETKAITVGNPQVVGFTIVNIAGKRRQIIFKPLKKGETTVTVRDVQEGSIRLIFGVTVTDSNLLRRASEVRDLLRDIEGIDIRIVGQKVVIDGEVLVPADYGRLLSVISDKSYAEVVMNLSTLSPLAVAVLAKRIQDDINTFASNVKTRVVNGMIFLEGTVDNVDMGKRAAEVAKLYLPDVRPGNPLAAKDPTAQVIQPTRALVWNFIVINPPPPKKQERLVRITVHFVELAKDYNKVFGFKWAPGFTSDPRISFGESQTGGTATSGGGSFAMTLSSLFPKLQSAQNAGFARVLKTGTVITRSGQEAKLNETTAFPYTVSDGNGNVSSQSAQVGLEVAVTPQILGQSEDIALDLDLNQLSLVRRPATASAAPVVAKHQVKTKLYVKSNESAAVAGVVSSEVGTDFNKDDPKSGSFSEGQGGAQTDALFTMLRSKAYRKQKGQFVIFVTPQIIENASEGTEDLKKNFRVKVK